MSKSTVINCLGIFVLLTCAVPAIPSPILSVETAYIFELPHSGELSDGGSVRITNLDNAPVTIDHVFITGWASGTAFDFGPENPQLCCVTPFGGPPAPAVLAPGGAGVYNEAGPPNPADTSNFVDLANPAAGIQIRVMGTFMGEPFNQVFHDSITYALTGGVNTGADSDVPIPYGPTASDLPEPATLPLVGGALLLMLGWRKFHVTRSRNLPTVSPAHEAFDSLA
jgi:hypothetical protein